MPLRRFALVTLCLAALLPLIVSCGSDVKKAQEFIEAGMYPQAISLLEKRNER